MLVCSPMRLGLVLSALLLLPALSCKSMRSTGPDRQARISSCLARCAPDPQSPGETRDSLAPGQLADARSPCEKQCYAIP